MFCMVHVGISLFFPGRQLNNFNVDIARKSGIKLSCVTVVMCLHTVDFLKDANTAWKS